MKTIIKPISILLSVLMLMGLLLAAPFTVSAAKIVDRGVTGNCTWTLDDEGTLTISGNGNMGNYFGSLAPWRHRYPMAGMFGGTHYIYTSDVKNVIIEEGVTSIGDKAFEDCKQLCSVTIPQSVREIGYHAFYNCSNLHATIPQSVGVIGKSAFYGCSGLVISCYHNSSAYFYAINNHHNFILIGSYSGTSGDCTWTLDNEGQLTISGNGAMENYDYGNAPWGFGVQSLVIEDGVTSIGECAFLHANLTSVTIPKSVTSIGRSAFNSSVLIHCYKDTPAHAYAISNCNSFTLIGGGSGTTGDCTWTLNGEGKLIIGNNIEGALEEETEGEDEVEVGVEEKDLGFEEETEGEVGVKMGNYNPYNHNPAPWGTGIQSVVIQNDVKNIGNCAFYGCKNLESFIIPGNVKNIGYAAFANCTGLNSVTIANGVKEISGNVFENCINLTAITIPISVEKIDNFTFANCEKLTSVTIQGLGTEISDYAFDRCDKEKLVIHCHENSKAYTFVHTHLL